MEPLYVAAWLSLNALAAYLTYRTVKRVNAAETDPLDQSATTQPQNSAHPSPPEMGADHAPAQPGDHEAPTVERDDPLPADVENVTCPNCGRTQELGYQFCEVCVTPLPH